MSIQLIARYLNNARQEEVRATKNKNGCCWRSVLLASVVVDDDLSMRVYIHTYTGTCWFTSAGPIANSDGTATTAITLERSDRIHDVHIVLKLVCSLIAAKYNAILF
jgi:hypothetical protein